MRIQIAGTILKVEARNLVLSVEKDGERDRWIVKRDITHAK